MTRVPTRLIEIPVVRRPACHAAADELSTLSYLSAVGRRGDRRRMSRQLLSYFLQLRAEDVYTSVNYIATEKCCLLPR